MIDGVIFSRRLVLYKAGKNRQIDSERPGYYWLVGDDVVRLQSICLLYVVGCFCLIFVALLYHS